MKPSPSKCDPDLGIKVHEHLSSIGIETPAFFDLPATDDEKTAQIQGLFAEIMEVMGLDLSDDSLRDTPSRVAKMFVDEVFYGLDYQSFPKATTVENKMRYDQMVIERNIEIKSYCEHHFVTIHGFAHIGYIPKDRVLGLSKLNRIADFFARRPQIQERMTAQIAETLKFILGTDDVIVVVSAVHHCVKSRGVEDSCSETITSQVSGVFKDTPSAREEFLRLISV